MYVQHKNEEKQKQVENMEKANTENSFLKDVILTTSPNMTKIDSPILGMYKCRQNENGLDNPAFIVEKF